MPLVSSQTDVAGRRIVLVSELAAAPERVWGLWASPGRLARWWGPPGQPMVVDHHDLQPGGEVRFHVATHDRGRVDARFEVTAVDRPRTLRFWFHTGVLEPVDVRVAIEALEGGRTRMTTTVELPSDEAMGAALDIGFERGLARSAARADDALAAP